MENILEIDDLHFQYGQIVALHGISLCINKGEIVTLLGGNGAGKTTTLSMIVSGWSAVQTSWVVTAS